MLLSVAVAGVALAVSTAVPLLGPLLVALVIGVAVANTPGVSRHVVGTAPRLDKLLLRGGIVLLGLKIAVGDVLALGVSGIVVVLATVVTTYAVTQVVGRALGLERSLVTLVAAGFSICGAAAIAAVESSIRARPKDVALAVALVTVFGTVMIGAVPALGHVLGLTDEQTAIWAGASIHEVAQVIAAASLIGAGGATVLAAATTVKLARVALLAPVQVVSARMCRSADATRRGPLVPLFLLGFLAAVVVRSTGVLPPSVLDVAGTLTTVLLSAAMFGLGTGIVARHLWPVPARALLLATISTLVAASVALALVTLLV
ncbi:YeiH family protein [Nocardioides hwasunensis]|uniref:Sulfate exporter family transporter n=2 Tax=Nocardioides hwasunensis TaxID=397258 RepID=A0ABR8MJK5_9ACTN|nr:putative sulfate exporter family transporter [Nocardioides hwasunensis]